MSMPHQVNIMEAIATKLRQIKTANGYNTELPDDHVFVGYERTFVDQARTDSYPAAFITSMGKRNEYRPNGQIWCAWSFQITLLVIKVQTTDSPELMIAKLEDDAKRVLFSDIKLGGLVELLEYTESMLDSETCYPEGVAVLGVVAQGYDY